MNTSSLQVINSGCPLRRISFNNPFNWLANKLNPAITEKEDKASHVLARQKKAEEGTGNLFDAAAVAADKTEKPTLTSPVIPRKKHSEVRTHSAGSLPRQY